MKSFEEIEVYSKTIDFTVDVFNLTETQSINKNIANQFERACLSISNNIAEGFELQSNKQFIKFLYIAKGSSGECRNLINVLYKLNQIDNKVYELLRNQCVSISRQLSNFIKYLKNSDIY